MLIGKERKKKSLIAGDTREKVKGIPKVIRRYGPKTLNIKFNGNSLKEKMVFSEPKMSIVNPHHCCG